MQSTGLEKVDVIIPAVDSMERLEVPLGAIQMQSHELKSIGVIVPVGAPPPELRRFLKGQKKHMIVPVRILERDEPLSWEACVDLGLESARADWVFIVARRTVLAVHAIEAFLETLVGGDPDVAYAYCDQTVVRTVEKPRIDIRRASQPEYDRDIELVTPGPFDPDRLRREDYIPHTVLVRRDAIPADGLDESLPALHMWDLYLRLLASGHKGVYVPERLIELYEPDESDEEAVSQARAAIAAKHGLTLWG